VKDDGWFAIYDVRYAMYDIIWYMIYDVRYSEQFSGISVRNLLLEWSSIEWSDFLIFYYMTYRVQIYLTTKKSKSFGELRIIALRFTKWIFLMFKLTYLNLNWAKRLSYILLYDLYGFKFMMYDFRFTKFKFNHKEHKVLLKM